MNKIKEIFEQLQSTNGKIEKENILKSNKDNQMLKDVIKFIYDPFILTGLSTKKINKQVPTTRSFFPNISSMMEYLKNNNTGTDNVIGDVQGFINVQPDNMREFYKGIFTKSIKLGCDSKTFNKIWGKDFIPEHEVQQAYSIDKYKMKENEWFSLSEKLNGIRGSYIDGKIISRQGHEIEGLEHIINDIEKLNISEFFIDGELVRKNIDNISDNENFRLSTSIINADDTDKSEIQFVIFDIITKEEFLNEESISTYKQRLEKFSEYKKEIKELNLQNIKFVDILYFGTDLSKIDIYLDLMVRQDKEGLMLNRDTPYKCKRHNGILKIKRFYTMDLKVINAEEGSGRLQGTLGALVVDFKGETVNVGSGFDDETRKQIWNNREDIIGRIIEVKYKEISKDKTGKESLQFPVFASLREEGKKVSYN